METKKLNRVGDIQAPWAPEGAYPGMKGSGEGEVVGLPFLRPLPSEPPPSGGQES